MEKGKEMFEAIEMHVERMLAKRSEQEKFDNPAWWSPSTLNGHFFG
jgi:hypothetical protein